MQDYVGKQIDRYHITTRLGMGGMAVVYKAFDTRLQRDVALKLIRTGSIPPDQIERMMKRFEREALSQAKFIHRHIVTIHDYGEVDGSPYLVMSYLPGDTLKKRMTRPVDWQEAVSWMIPVADALGYAHQRGVIHRDVKPANILFDEEGQPILTDFGIAKILETDEATLTTTGMGVGTPEYMAPEQWQGKPCPASDQYALGVVLYELIAGQKPFSADTPAAIILMQATEPLRAPSKIVKDIPEAVEKVLYKALAIKTGDRYEDMGAFQNALTGLLVESPAGQTPKQVFTAPGLQIDPTQTLAGVNDFITYEDSPDRAGKTKIEKMEPFSIREEPHLPVDSEGETRDAFEPTIKPQGTGRKLKVNEKRRSNKLPKWAIWIGGGTVGLILIGLIIAAALGVFSGGGEDAVETPTEIGAVLAETTQPVTETVLPSPTFTLTLSPTITNTATNAPTFTPTLGIGSVNTNKKDNAEMVYVPGRSSLEAFWIYKFEVTNAQYRQCILGSECKGDLEDYPDNNYPAVYITWFEADDYCKRAGGRLPTEAEWVLAAYGDDGRTYPWGEVEPTCENDYANFGNCEGGTTPVGSFREGASPYSALDMAGNVWEWVEDWYSNDQTYKIIRGGSWVRDEWLLRVSDRSRNAPDNSYYNLGFRCLLLPEP